MTKNACSSQYLYKACKRPKEFSSETPVLEGIKTKNRVEESLKEGLRLMYYANIIVQNSLRNKKYIEKETEHDP